jgi:hypothetical protein
MKNHFRTIAALVFVLAILIGGWFVYRAATRDNTNRAEAMTQSVADSGSADAQVCSHISPAPYLWGPAGDWKTPAVAAVASGASPLVRDAYFTAASALFPDSANWSGTFPPFQRAMSQLATVCAAVRARP